MDKTFVIDIRNKRAKNLSKIKYVCGNTDYLVAFDLDEDWSGVETKTARFHVSDGTVIDTPFTGSTCPFPKIMDAYRVDVGIFANNLKTSTNAIVECERSALSNDGPPPNPAPDVYARIMELLNAGVSEEQIARAVEKYMKENPADATLSIGGRAADAKATGDAVRQLSEEIAKLQGEEAPVNVTIDMDGVYVQKNGEKGTSKGFAMYTPLWLSDGDKIRFTARGYNGNVSVLSIVPTTGNRYTSIIIPDDDVEREYSHTATVSGYYVISSNKDANVTCYKTGDPVSEMVAIVGKLQKTVDSLAGNDVFAFVKVGVIGDSLASGASNYTDSSGTTKTADRPAYSWGKYIEREHGIPVTLFSKGGASTRTWLSSDWGKAAMESAEPCDCYIIGLGVNDKSLGEDYVGTIDDVIVGNESNNADTFFGNYSKIIAALIEKSPRCKIFCLNLPATQTNPGAYNYAIISVAQLYSNAYLIDLHSDDYFGGSEYTALWNVAHSTAAGYKAIADHLWKRLNAYMHENLSEFTDIQWILEDHT